MKLEKLKVGLMAFGLASTIGAFTIPHTRTFQFTGINLESVDVVSDRSLFSAFNGHENDVFKIKTKSNEVSLTRRELKEYSGDSSWFHYSVSSGSDPLSVYQGERTIANDITGLVAISSFVGAAFIELNQQEQYNDLIVSNSHLRNLLSKNMNSPKHRHMKKNN